MDINIKVGGAAGLGIKSVGMAVAKTFSRLGYKVFEYSEYPSLIRGGHNTETIHISDQAAYSQVKPVDILLALDKNTLELDVSEVKKGGAVVFDEIAASPLDKLGTPRNDVKWFKLAMLEIAKNLGNPLLMNTVGIGAILKLTGLATETTAKIISEEFSRKGKDVVETNLKALDAGFQAVNIASSDSSTGRILKGVSLKEGKNQLLLTGSEAVGLGVIAAGIGLYASYPMTPASPLLHFLAAHQMEFGYVVRQPEDEIAAANMVIGAMHSGVRAMCGTSGGGFALMNETLALAAMTETPMVIYLAQRPGPATGLPTWTEQGELSYAIAAGHGEFLRFVLAPGDPREAFLMAADAFNLAERYQSPVIILSDKYLGESAMTIDGLDLDSVSIDRGLVLTERDLSKRKNFQRYELTADGISQRSLPGMAGGVYTANSDEHEYHGSVDESSQMRVWQQGKRLKKEVAASVKMPGPKLIGDPGAEMTIISWGSGKMPSLQAVEMLRGRGPVSRHPPRIPARGPFAGAPPRLPPLDVNLLHFSYIWPMNREAVNSALSNIGSRTLIVENNATGQFESLLKSQVGFVPMGRLRKFDGRPIYPEEIIMAVERLV